MHQVVTFTCEVCGRDYQFGVDLHGNPVGYCLYVCSSFCDGRKQERAINKIQIDQLKVAYSSAEAECAAKEAELQKAWKNYRDCMSQHGFSERDLRPREQHNETCDGPKGEA